MRIVQVKCPSCNQAIMMKEKDKLFYCDKCNVMHIREGGAPVKVDFEIAEFSPNAQGERVYMPFWRLYTTLIVRSKNVEGGTIFKMSQWLKGGSDNGSMFIYIPAAELDAGTFRKLSTMFTGAAPRYPTRLNFGNVRRLPGILPKDEAAQLADFVVVTMEAEQPGVLQQLDYSLTVNDTKLVYLPFVMTPQGPVSAL
jgi:hypothetical protein